MNRTGNILQVQNINMKIVDNFFTFLVAVSEVIFKFVPHSIAHRTSHIAHRTSHIAHRTSHIAHAINYVEDIFSYYIVYISRAGFISGAAFLLLNILKN